MASSCSSTLPPVSTSEQWYRPTQKYDVLNVQGTFGSVVKCFGYEKRQIVAIKMAKTSRNLRKEASLLRVLMDHNLDQRSIIKCFGFHSNGLLVFEALDISLMDYLNKRKAPMLLKDIRTVIQQLATALDALKNVGVIHCDVKTKNIMLVDHVRQPFKVKLFNFDLAQIKSDAKLKKIVQVLHFRAPECILGLPVSEAIDIWSLGCVMGFMAFRFSLFPGKAKDEILQYIIDLMGSPPDHVIEAGKNSKKYFKRTDSKQWVLKTHEGCCSSTRTSFRDNRRYKFRSLDEVKTMRLEENNTAEADERSECTELLKAMFKWDERERITPREILTHPFITMSYLSSNSSDEASDSAVAESTTVQTGEPGTQQTPGVSSNYRTLTSTSENRSLPEETRDEKSVSENDTNSALTLEDTNHPEDPEDGVKRFFSWFQRNLCCCPNVGAGQTSHLSETSDYKS